MAKVSQKRTKSRTNSAKRVVGKGGRSSASKTNKTSRASKNGEFTLRGKDKRFVRRDVKAARSITEAVNYSSADAQDHSEKANTHLLQAWHKLHATHVKASERNLTSLNGEDHV